MNDTAVYMKEKRTARMAGALYFTFLCLGIFSEFVRGSLAIPGDAAATVRNLLANETLFRLSAFSELAGETVFVFLALALYALFRDIHRAAARTMVALVVASVPIAMMSVLGLFAMVNAASQNPDGVMMFFQLYTQGTLIATIFWGLWLFPFGWLAYKSGFIPRILGALLMAGCFGFLIVSFVGLVFPGHDALTVPGMVVVTVAEVATIFWLLVFGTRRPGGKKS